MSLGGATHATALLASTRVLSLDRALSSHAVGSCRISDSLNNYKF